MEGSQVQPRVRFKRTAVTPVTPADKEKLRSWGTSQSLEDIGDEMNSDDDSGDDRNEETA